MGSHAAVEGPVGKVAGSITLVPLFNVDRALDTLSKFEIPCASINHLAITRVIAENVGHSEYKFERIAGKKVIFLPLQDAAEVDADFAVGLLQALFDADVLVGFYVTVASDSGIREHQRPR